MIIDTEHGRILLDDEDAAAMLAIALVVDRRGYMSVRGSNRKGGVRRFVHSLIMGTPPGMHTDHVNGNKLDNRRENLRVCTPAQNLRNRKPRKSTRSGYKGVQWSSAHKSWRAIIRADGRVYSCGRSTDPIKAAKKYDRKARELHGEYARPNFSCCCWLDETCPVCLAPPDRKQ
jgi:hypothetical protein